MRPERQSRRWLRFDAYYCGAAGVVAVGLAGPLGRLFHVPTALIAAIGLATVTWAWLLLRLSRRDEWRQPLQLVAAANVVASVGVGVLAVIAPALAGRLLLAAIAVEVATFAAVQLRLLRHV